MIRPVVQNRARFRLRWLAEKRGPTPGWLTDPDWVPPGNRALYTRVKDGFAALLADLDRSGVVLLPAYVPGGFVSAVLAAGYDVRYYPVDADLSLPVDAIEERIESLSPAVVVFVHYFGFAADAYPRLRDVAREHGAMVVEDCARGLFSRGPDGALLGSSGDVALYCVHKTLPVPNGGLVVRRDGPLPEPTEVRSEWSDLLRVVAASAIARLGVGPLSTPRPVVGERGTPWVREFDGRPLQSPGGLSRRALARCRPAAVQAARIERYRVLYDRLDGTGVAIVTPRAPPGAAPYGLGVLAPTEPARNRLLGALHRRRLPGEVLTWPPVHRHEEVFADDGAMTLRRQLLVLPTHEQVPETVVTAMADCVAEQLGGSTPNREPVEDRERAESTAGLGRERTPTTLAERN